MKKKYFKTSALAVVAIFLVVGTAAVIYCFFLSVEIEKRFSGRRWQIPSTVYSDVTLLYPGQKINQTLFRQKLERLGYQRVSKKINAPGEMQFSLSRVAVFLKGSENAGRPQESYPVLIQLDSQRIQSITRMDTQESLPILEIEPEELMLFFGPEREQRRLISMDRIPRHLIHAVLSIEDVRYFQHPGIDPVGIVRALIANVRSGEIRQGGSTITQQLAKNYFLTQERTFSRKFREILISLTMEALYDKKTLMEIYLNEIYFGQKGPVSINGVGEAADFFFGKTADRLSLSESALLAGLIKAPNRYSPHFHPEAARSRRNQVLNAMAKEGWITKEQHEEAESAPIRAVGFSRYGKKAPYFMDYVSGQLSQLYPKDVLSGMGFAIITSLDTEVQAAAENALASGLKRLENNHPGLRRTQPGKRLQGAIVAMHPKTGAVLAMVGGRDYSSSQFNRISHAKRQPGSTIKPFIYVDALDEATPASLLSNSPKTYTFDGQTWEPKNYRSIPQSQIRLKEALAFSVNLATVDLAMALGMERMSETIRRFGFSTPVKPYPSMSLGAFEVIPMELARAFCVFAADGVQPFPISIKEVRDEENRILESKYIQLAPLITPQKAFLMTSILEYAMTHGTGRSAKKLGVAFPAAGKTGTTNDYRDAWFVGYTPEVLILVWVGFDDNTSIGLSGAEAALPIWADVMTAIGHRLSQNPFHVPDGVRRIKICTQSGDMAREGACPVMEEEFFLVENAPQRQCTLHQTTDPSFMEGEKGR